MFYFLFNRGFAFWYFVASVVVLYRNLEYFIPVYRDDNVLAAINKSSSEIFLLFMYHVEYVDKENFLVNRLRYVLGCPYTNNLLNVTWYIDGKKFNDTKVESRPFTRGPLIVFDTVLREDAGTYQCYQNDELIASTRLYVISFWRKYLRVNKLYIKILSYSILTDALYFYTCIWPLGMLTAFKRRHFTKLPSSVDESICDMSIGGIPTTEDSHHSSLDGIVIV